MQNYEKKRAELVEEFQRLRHQYPRRFEKRLNLSWSNWGFGLEDLETSVVRLRKAGLQFIELHGNHYGPNLGYDAEATAALLQAHGMRVSGVCGMFSEENDLSSNRPHQQQAAIEYIKRELEFTKAVGGSYLLVVPGAVGRAIAYDEFEFDRSVEALRLVADLFEKNGVKGAVEPIRRDEVTLVNTVSQAIEYIIAVERPGVQHINGDVFHMQAGESSIPEAIIQAGDRLVNLHMADSNRLALGSGTMDIDAIIMALYLIGFNADGRYVTPEPLGPGASPYVARNGRVDSEVLDTMVHDSIAYFREREEAVLSI